MSDHNAQTVPELDFIHMSPELQSHELPAEEQQVEPEQVAATGEEQPEDDSVAAQAKAKPRPERKPRVCHDFNRRVSYAHCTLQAPPYVPSAPVQKVCDPLTPY